MTINELAEEMFIQIVKLLPADRELFVILASSNGEQGIIFSSTDKEKTVEIITRCMDSAVSREIEECS